MRAYVPLTMAGLRMLRDTGVIGPVPVAAYAVTPALRESYAVGDDEEMEYAALSLAARASLRRLLATPDAPRRRVVVVADVAESDLHRHEEDERGAVAVIAEIPLARVNAVHVDDPAVDLDDAEGWELMWFAVQEMDVLLDS